MPENKGLENKLKSLTAKKEALFARVQTLFDLGKNIDKRGNLEKFTTLYESLDSTRQTFEQVLDVINDTSLEMDSKNVPSFDALNSFDELYCSIKIVAKKVLAEKSSSSVKRECSNKPIPRLPKLVIPTFDGDLSSWTAFYECFRSLIHENGDLTNVDKMHYLMGALTGSAKTLFSGLPPTGENYDIIWKKLVEKYQDNRKLAAAYLDAIVGFKTLQFESANNLDLFLDKFDSSVSAFKKLDIGDFFDFTLAHLALSKLDHGSRRTFETLRGGLADIPSYSEVVEFVKARSKVLLSTGSGKTSSSNSAKTTSSSGCGLKPKIAHSFLVENSDKQRKCPVCSQDFHSFSRCSKFLKYTPKERYNFAKENYLCLNCLSRHKIIDCKSKLSCAKCGKRHHYLLCFENMKRESSAEEGQNMSSPSAVAGTICSTASFPCKNTNSVVLLSTAVVRFIDGNGSLHTVRFLLDSGSQANFITGKCARRLKLCVSKYDTTVLGLGSNSNVISGKTSLVVISRLDGCKKFVVDALVVDKISDKLPSLALSRGLFSAFADIPLADDLFYQPTEIDGILGADMFASLVGKNKVFGPQGTPVALETDLGYVIMGRVPVSMAYSSENTSTFCGILEPSLEILISRFWEIEEISSPIVLSKEDSECERMFSSTYSREKDGRYTVSLPFKEDPSVLGDSYKTALRRFLNLEKRLESSDDLRLRYNQAMQDYITRGHMVKVADGDLGLPGYYIPHLGVFKDSSSTPLRIVFDAGAKTDNFVSLNDILYTGPKLQSDVVAVLLNFRLFEVAMTADIRQMYRMINVCEEHRQFQRLLWRFSSDDPLSTYELTTVVFGLNSSPFLALRTVRQLATDEIDSFPEASRAVFHDMYMDDYVTSVPKLDRAIALFQQMVGLFRSGGFSLVKWSSNSQDLLSEIPEDLRSTEMVQFCSQTLRILGLQWNPHLDVLSFQISPPDTQFTKRKILSAIARIYDPLGILSPVVLYAKLLMKELWELKIDWDDIVPPEIFRDWDIFCREFPILCDFSIPRHIGISENCSISLVGFADACEKAYGGVVYTRICLDGQVSVSLVVAKSRVTPLRVVSIPRLELMAILLLAKLMRFLIDNFSAHKQVHLENIFAFSDSMVALSWINASPHRWKTFVANRVARVQELLPTSHWYHVKGVENPADHVSRGLTPSQFIKSTDWVSGPSWLYLDIDSWPLNSLSSCKSNLEEKVATLVALDGGGDIVDGIYSDLIARISSWKRLLRIMVYVLRFCRILSVSPRISASDLDKAEECLVKVVQIQHFAAEINSLKNRGECSPGLRKLRPFMKDGVLLVGGRLGNANLSFSQKHPILLPKSDHFVNLLIDHYHQKNLHTGAHLTLALLRQKYWILTARSVVRKRIQNCNTCFRSRPKPQFPLMADLPACRVQEAQAFAHTGLDYAGPVLINISRNRGAKSQKAYICLFICLTTKALHLELVSDLSTANFIQALKRFLSRRGPCRTLYSDCGTNFIGAKNYLDDLYRLVGSKEFSSKLSDELSFRKIEWKFNPPSAPHFGGIWEANVKAVKTHLYKVVGQQILSYEEFNTFLVQIESLLNSRPLCSLSSDPGDPTALTPAHFLNVTPIESLPSTSLSDVPLNRLSRFQLIDRMVQSYWRRWHLEYLNTLQGRERWNKSSDPIAPGTVVVVKQDNSAPMHWPMAVVEEVFPGKDGVIRVASVRTKHGILKRPVVKLCPLPSQ